MFVKNIMLPRQECVVVEKDVRLNAVLEKMWAHNVDGVPVLDGNKYVGLVTKYLIYKQFFLSGLSKDDYLAQTKAGEIAERRDRYLSGEEIFEYTLLELKKYPILAVVNGDRDFVGLVTRYDVLEQFQSAFGMKRKGIRIAFTSIETEGRIATFTELADKYKEDIISLVTFDESDHLVRRIVLKIEKKDTNERFIKELSEAGFRILDIQEC